MTNNKTNTKDYPKDGKLRPVTYDAGVDKIVKNVCKGIHSKHAKFMEDANIEFEDFQSECATRVWKGLSQQFTGSSSVKSYVYIICHNHWRNVVTRFFNYSDNFQKNREKLVTSEYSKLFVVPTNSHNDNNIGDNEMINMTSAHPEYDDDIDIEYDEVILRKLIWFTYRNYKHNILMARGVILCHSGKSISGTAEELGLNVKKLTREYHKTRDILNNNLVFDELNLEFNLKGE